MARQVSRPHWARSVSGSLTYSGNPQVKQEISGSGQLIKK
jgi:hypothetical protein